jgi:hypothetical protein
MKLIILSVFFLFVVCTIGIQPIYAQDFKGVTELSLRIAPWTKNKIVFHSIASTGNERFELFTKNNQLHIYATSASAASAGFNYYLNRYCKQMVSHCGDNLKPLKILPDVKNRLVIETPFQYRYALNYCTFNYSMSFYQWKDWERELDWMAMHGVNLMLAIDGTEIVWQKTLQHFGFTDKEIKNFIPGPAFTAWWLMGNLEGWGGPVTDDMINRQMQLQKKILARMKELGIEPVLQGFYGMVPTTLKNKFPAAKIVDQGKWVGGFQRPAFLSPQDSLFPRMADAYYQNIKEIYGDCKFFGGDPFHEGGTREGLDVSASATNIQLQMRKNFPNSTWVLQAWQSNPGKELLRDLNKDKTLVLELNGESQQNWEQTDAFGKTPWIWCSVNNFGETPGLSGKLEHILSEPQRALQTPEGRYMKGIGIIPEGILNNPLVFDLALNSAWGKKMDTDSLLFNYILYRYGEGNDEVYNALFLLKKTVYASQNGGGSESLFAAKPAKEINSVSTWGSRKIVYDTRLLENALKLFLQASGKFTESETFRYDLTDIARQVLSNCGKMAYDSTMKYFNQKDIARYSAFKNDFLTLINLQEQLMATNKSCMVGTRLQQAMDFGKTEYEKKLAETNARMQITIWGPDTNPETDLHEYAHKEWAGLIKDLYLPRWEAFFKQLDSELQGNPSKEIDFFSMELAWARGHNTYPTKPEGDYKALIKQIIWYYDDH